MINKLDMSIEYKLLLRYQPVVLTESDIGHKFICVFYNYKVTGTLIRIEQPCIQGQPVYINNGKDVRRLIVEGFTFFRVSDIAEKHITRLVPSLPTEISKYIVQYQ